MKLEQATPAELARIFKAAEDHACDTCEPEHQVGDLEDALRFAWQLMNSDQRVAFVERCNVNLVGLGADGDEC